MIHKEYSDTPRVDIKLGDINDDTRGTDTSYI
jgi:hypothetical protein